MIAAYLDDKKSPGQLSILSFLNSFSLDAVNGYFYKKHDVLIVFLKSIFSNRVIGLTSRDDVTSEFYESIIAFYHGCKSEVNAPYAVDTFDGNMPPEVKSLYESRDLMLKKHRPKKNKTRQFLQSFRWYTAIQSYMWYLDRLSNDHWLYIRYEAFFGYPAYVFDIDNQSVFSQQISKFKKAFNEHVFDMEFDSNVECLLGAIGFVINRMEERPSMSFIRFLFQSPGFTNQFETSMVFL